MGLLIEGGVSMWRNSVNCELTVALPIIIIGNVADCRVRALNHPGNNTELEMMRKFKREHEVVTKGSFQFSRCNRTSSGRYSCHTQSISRPSAHVIAGATRRRADEIFIWSAVREIDRWNFPACRAQADVDIADWHSTRVYARQVASETAICVRIADMHLHTFVIRYHSYITDKLDYLIFLCWNRSVSDFKIVCALY